MKLCAKTLPEGGKEFFELLFVYVGEGVELVHVAQRVDVCMGGVGGFVCIDESDEFVCGIEFHHVIVVCYLIV